MKKNDKTNDKAVGGVGAVLLLIIVVVGAVAGAYFFWFVGRTAVVATTELDPVRIQEKYEWFKDASAQLDAKVASIGVYQGRITRMDKMYEGIPRSSWSRADIDSYNLYESEVGGIKASYNTLAATYNAEMVKWNWRFTNYGDLPHGATKVLPREYKPYQES